MSKKYILILVIALLTAFIAIFLFLKKSDNNTNTVNNSDSKNQDNSATDSVKNKFLLDGYPVEAVPLYKLKEIESSKIFVNTDPNTTSMFEDHNFAYFNLVFETSATQREFLEYYQSLFDKKVVEEFSNPDMVKGVIGEYKVTAAHYGSDDTAYLQVFLPKYDDPGMDGYFSAFPQLFELHSYFTEHEKSYGFVNQKGGENEFTKYYTVKDSGDQDKDGKDDVDEFSVLEEQYKSQLQNEQAFSVDAKEHSLGWKKDVYSVTLSLSRDHGRIYLMIRSPLK